jgi:hypothetical protein
MLERGRNASRDTGVPPCWVWLVLESVAASSAPHTCQDARVTAEGYLVLAAAATMLRSICAFASASGAKLT